MFVNCSNHPSANWGREQMQAAETWGQIVDYPFPMVDAAAGKQQIATLSERIVDEIIEMKPAAVMCQGEFTLSFAIITRLKKKGIVVVAACSERRVVEEVLENGKTQKTSRFEFVQFREY